MPESVKKETLISCGCICVETLDEAFKKYKSVILKTDDKLKMWKFMERVYEENQGQMYADFYYPVLELEQQENFMSGLNEQEKEILAGFETEQKQVYYKVEKKDLQFLFDITARNWLFSTFYCGNRKAMIWGNYDLEFPIFCEDEEVLEEYLKLANDCGLEKYI